MDLSRFGYQKRKHRVLLAPTPESTVNPQPILQPSHPSPTTLTPTSRVPAGPLSSPLHSPTTVTGADSLAPLHPTPPLNITSHTDGTSTSAASRPRKKRRTDTEILYEEWMELYWFKGHHMEAILDDYSLSYDSHFNQRKSRRIAQRLLLTAA